MSMTNGHDQITALMRNTGPQIICRCGGVLFLDGRWSSGKPDDSVMQFLFGQEEALFRESRSLPYIARWPTKH